MAEERENNSGDMHVDEDGMNENAPDVVNHGMVEAGPNNLEEMEVEQDENVSNENESEEEDDNVNGSDLEEDENGPIGSEPEEDENGPIGSEPEEGENGSSEDEIEEENLAAPVQLLENELEENIAAPVQLLENEAGQNDADNGDANNMELQNELILIRIRIRHNQNQLERDLVAPDNAENDEENRLVENEPILHIIQDPAHVNDGFFDLTPHRTWLSVLLPYLTHQEMKNFRVTCKLAKQVVDNHPLFRNATLFVNPTWIYDAGEIYDKDTYYRFTSAIFDTVPLTFCVPFHERFAQEDLRTLVLRGSRVRCTHLTLFINECVNLQEVTFDKITITTTKINRGRWNPPHQQFCRNENLVPQFHDQFAPIRSITFRNMSLIPLCLLNLLIQRSTGALQEFHFLNDHMQWTERDDHEPSDEHVKTRLSVLIGLSHNTLQKFSYQTVARRGDRHLQTIFLDTQALMPLEELSFGPFSDAIDVPQPYENIINLPRYQQLDTGLRYLSLHFNQGFNWERLEPFLYNLAGLEKLSLAFFAAIRVPAPPQNGGPRQLENLQVGFNLDLERIPTLRELEVSSEKGSTAPVNLNLFQESPIPATLVNLSLHVNKLAPLTSGRLIALLSEPNAQSLKKLHLGLGGDQVTDDVMQAIIGNLVNLEELHIRNSNSVTDQGITGIPDQTIMKLSDAKSPLLLGSIQDLLDNERCLRPLSELRRLRILDLAYCVQVTDASIMFAFKFPQLREVDLTGLPVTDAGLCYLVKENPTMSKITVNDNLCVTQAGLSWIALKETITFVETILPTYERLMKGLDIVVPSVAVSPKLITTGRRAPKKYLYSF